MSNSQKNPELTTNPASTLLVAEISHALRAQGRPGASGLIPDDGDNSPVVLGQYAQIPQSQVGMIDFASFEKSASNFNSPVGVKVHGI